MTASTFTTTSRDFHSSVNTPHWLAPFGVSPIDPLGSALMGMIHAAWKAIDPDTLGDVTVRVIVVVTDDAIALRIEPLPETVA